MLSKIAFVEKNINATSLSLILSDIGIQPSEFRGTDNLSTTNLLDYNLLILPHNISKEENYAKIRDFVLRGGICWIMHQDNENLNMGFLPENLSKVKLENRYLDTPVDHSKEYVGPWILKRNHPIWNKPDYLDESAFVFWDLDVDGEQYRTSATHIISYQEGWDVLAGFADHKIKITDNAAIVMEARYGKGLYFWTQILSPQTVWDKENSFEKNSWRLFLNNILSYFKDYVEGKLLKIRTETEPWSLLAGDNVKIRAIIEEKVSVDAVTMEVSKPDGEKEEIKEIKTEDGICYESLYTPDIGGDYKVRIIVKGSNGVESSAHAFFKVTKGLTPYRFITHTHFQSEWCPESLGLLFGACKQLGIDAVVLVCGLFYSDENLYQKISLEEIKLIDNPQVRFFPGEEIHCMHQYTAEEGCPLDNPDSRHHATTLGCFNLYPYSNDYWSSANLVKIHQHGGLAIVAHPLKDTWWMESQDGHNFEGIEFDRTDTSNWDKMLKKNEFVVGISGVDNLGINWLPLRGPNTGWFDCPLNYENLIKTIIRGRVTKINTYPLPFEAMGSYFWFDINNQIVGGTVYASSKVKLHIKVKSHLPVQMLWVVKGGNKHYIKIEPNIKVLDEFIEDDIAEDTYYRLEMSNCDKYWADYGVPCLTNAIFVKKVEGPDGAYFYFTNDAPLSFNNKKGKYQPNFTQLKEVKFLQNTWEINLYEPASKGYLHIDWEETHQVQIDGKKTELVKGMDGKIIVSFEKGEHRIKVFSKFAVEEK